jgi:hypothetical protein
VPSPPSFHPQQRQTTRRRLTPLSPTPRRARANPSPAGAQVGVDVVGPQAPQQLAQAAAERRHLRVRFPPTRFRPSFCPLLSWLFFPPKNFFLPAEHFSFFAHSLAAAATALLLPYAGPGALPCTRAFSPVSRASSSAPIHASLSVQPEPESQPNEAEAATEEVKTETAPAVYAAARLA